MARLPQPGSDSGTWGDILNEYLSQTHQPDGSLKDNIVTASTIVPNAITATEIQDGTIHEAQLDASVQNKLNTAGSGNVADNTITTAKLHDEAVTDAKVATGAAIAQSKIANLTTDLAGKAATSHTHAAAQISDSTSTGRSLVTAADAAAARTAIGAGTSNLALGTSSSTAKAGDYTPTKSDVGLGNVDNTSDATKNSTTATLTNKTISGSSNTLSNITLGSLATTGSASASTYLRGDGQWAAVPAGDAYTNTSSSVDSEVALFSGTGGKTLKRATGTGVAKLTSGVLATAVAGTDYLAPAAIGTTVQAYDPDLDAWATKTAPTGSAVGTSDTQTLTNKTLVNPQLQNFTETARAIGTVTTVHTFDLSYGTVQAATLTASTACVFTMPTVGVGKSFTLFLKQAASTGLGSATFTGVKWQWDEVPVVTTGAGKMDIFTFTSDGTNWYGSVTQGFTP